MGKEIKRTNSSKKERKRDYDELESYHQVAIDMRLDGYTYFAISSYLRNKAEEDAKKTKTEPMRFPESLIRKWFMTGGILHFAYTKKKKERTKERLSNWEQREELIQDGALEGIAVLKRLQRGKGMVARQAAADLIRLASLEPAQKHEVENKTPTTVVIDLEEIKNAAIGQDNKTEA